MMHDNDPDPLRAIWQDQISNPLSFPVEQLRRASKRLGRRVFWRNLREFMAVAIVVFAMGKYLVSFHDLLSRLGSALIMIGVLYVAYHLWRNGSVRQISHVADPRICAEFYRAELVRQRDLLESVWRWYILPLVPGVTLFFVGIFRLVLGVCRE
jgi:uncharacterized membrane protein YfcA